MQMNYSVTRGSLQTELLVTRELSRKLCRTCKTGRRGPRLPGRRFSAFRATVPSGYVEQHVPEHHELDPVDRRRHVPELRSSNHTAGGHPRTGFGGRSGTRPGPGVDGVPTIVPAWEVPSLRAPQVPAPPRVGPAQHGSRHRGCYPPPRLGVSALSGCPPQQDNEGAN
jgi:hypothetical protein